MGQNENDAKNRFFGGFGHFGGLSGACRGTEKGKYGSMHTGNFDIYHSMDTSLQETFPINQLDWINYRKWVISKLKIGNNWKLLGTIGKRYKCHWESGFFEAIFPISQLFPTDIPVESLLTNKTWQRYRSKKTHKNKDQTEQRNTWSS